VGSVEGRLRDVIWLKPELVADIKFLEFTPEGFACVRQYLLGLRPGQGSEDVHPRDSRR